MPDASISLGLNATDMYGELKNAESRFSAGMDRMGKSTNQLAGSHETLLRSSHRVATQIHNVSRDMLSGASASDILANSLEGIGRAMNISLGALAGLAVGAAIIERIGTAVLKAHQLRDAIAEIGKDTGSSTAQYDSLAVIDARLASIKARLKELKAEHASAVSALSSSGPATQRGVDAANRQYGEEEDALGRGLSERNQELAAEQARKQIRVDQIRRTQGDDAANRKVAYDKHSDEYFAAAREGNEPGKEVALAKLNETIARLDATLQKMMMEHTGRTIGEIAATPRASSWYNADGTVGTLSYEQWNAGNQARQVQDLTAQAEQARIGGDQAGAARLAGQAGDIANGIAGVKPSEQMGSDLKTALQVTEEKLEQISKNTANLFKGK
jgi:hypothetical protein